MGLLSTHPAALLAQQREADNAALSVGSAIAATCLVVAFIGVPVLVILGVIALIMRPDANVMHPAWISLIIVASCWVVALAVGLVLTAVGRRRAAHGS